MWRMHEWKKIRSNDNLMYETFDSFAEMVMNVEVTSVVRSALQLIDDSINDFATRINWIHEVDEMHKITLSYERIGQQYFEMR